MQSLAPDLLPIAVWMIVAIGGALLGLLSYGGRLMLGRLDKTDASLEAIRELLASEIQKLRELHHDVDKRLIRIETACNYMHSPENQHRRVTD